MKHNFSHRTPDRSANIGFGKDTNRVMEEAQQSYANRIEFDSHYLGRATPSRAQFDISKVPQRIRELSTSPRSVIIHQEEILPSVVQSD